MGDVFNGLLIRMLVLRLSAVNGTHLRLFNTKHTGGNGQTLGFTHSGGSSGLQHRVQLSPSPSFRFLSTEVKKLKVWKSNSVFWVI